MLYIMAADIGHIFLLYILDVQYGYRIWMYIKGLHYGRTYDRTLLEHQTLRESHAIERHSSDKQTPEYHLCGGTAGN